MMVKEPLTKLTATQALDWMLKNTVVIKQESSIEFVSESDRNFFESMTIFEEDLPTVDVANLVETLVAACSYYDMMLGES
tara:strand:+ start:567 stop:806 length:240 start_codon:yes stop_codon:yes gene_type:complete